MKKFHFTITASGLSKAKQAALQEFKTHPPLKKNLYLEADNEGVCMIVSNLTEVGEAKLERISSFKNVRE